MSRTGLLAALVGVAVALAVAAGVPVRATYGAPVSGDEPQYLLTALSLAEDGDLDISDELRDGRYRDFHPLPLDPQTRPLDGGVHISPHDPLLPLLLAAPVAVGGALAAELTLAAVAGLCAALLTWTAIRRLGVRPRTATAVVTVLAVSPPLATYGTQIYPEIVAATLVVAAVAGLAGARAAGRWLSAAAVVALPWLAVKYVPVAAVLALATLLVSPRRSRWVLLGLWALAAVGYAAIHQAVWGGWTAYASGDHFVVGEFTAVGRDPDLLGRSTRLVGLLVDRAFGIAAWQPAWLLVVPAAVAALRWGARRTTAPDGPAVDAPAPDGPAVDAPDSTASTGPTQRASTLRLLVALVAVGWLVATYLALTMHGWWFAGRQVVVVLPAAALLVAVWADRTPTRRVVAICSGLVGVVAWGWLLADGWQGRLTWVVDFAATGDPLYRAWRLLLPDYMAPHETGTWILHGLWTAALLLAAVATAYRLPDRPTVAVPATQTRRSER